MLRIYWKYAAVFARDSWDKDDEEDGEDMTFLQGLQRYWDAIYAEELVSFREHGLAGEIWCVLIA